MTDASATSTPLDETARKVEFLRRAENYPDDTADVEVEETHMSWVFLTARHAYKMKKPVRFAYLDFTTLDKRRYDCHEELRLNRRLARDVYLDVVALTEGPSGTMKLQGGGIPIEWLVKMRRLPRDRMLDHAIERGVVGAGEVRRFTRVLCDFYRRAVPVPMSDADYRQRYERDARVLAEELLSPDYRLPAARINRIRDRLLGWLERHGNLLKSRIEGRRIVEAHGDLRPQHVCLTDPPVFIDCLEFKREFRILDPVEELAFLAMECEQLGAHVVSDTVMDTYHEYADDHPPATLVNFYKAERALLRAALSIGHLRDRHVREREKWVSNALAYLDTAEAYTGRPG